MCPVRWTLYICGITCDDRNGKDLLNAQRLPSIHRLLMNLACLSNSVTHYEQPLWHYFYNNLALHFSFALLQNRKIPYQHASYSVNVDLHTRSHIVVTSLYCDVRFYVCFYNLCFVALFNEPYLSRLFSGSGVASYGRNKNCWRHNFLVSSTDWSIGHHRRVVPSDDRRVLRMWRFPDNKMSAEPDIRHKPPDLQPLFWLFA